MQIYRQLKLKASSVMIPDPIWSQSWVGQILKSLVLIALVGGPGAYHFAMADNSGELMYQRRNALKIKSSEARGTTYNDEGKAFLNEYASSSDFKVAIIVTQGK